ncbi:MAG: orotidine-5'-phosphate decarboxylase [Bryobacter sp.]|nr:orotidine-5'-phosphate decarboxylase [Bryobacter sp.]
MAALDLAPQTNPIIIALDVESSAAALALESQVGEAVDFYKIGLELFIAAGPTLVKEFKARGKRVFLDLKLHDIGETVRRAVARAAELEVDLLTVHATGQVMRAAVEGKGQAALRLLGVTVLTSLGEEDLEVDGYPLGTTVASLVEKRVHTGVAAHMDGFVCSALEVARVRQIAGPQAVLVTPGVRSDGAATGDQKRVATPAEALANGATFLVIGRQITRAKDPAAAARAVLAEVGRA